MKIRQFQIKKFTKYSQWTVRATIQLHVNVTFRSVIKIPIFQLFYILRGQGLLVFWQRINPQCSRSSGKSFTSYFWSLMWESRHGVKPMFTHMRLAACSMRLWHFCLFYYTVNTLATCDMACPMPICCTFKYCMCVNTFYHCRMSLVIWRKSHVCEHRLSTNSQHPEISPFLHVNDRAMTFCLEKERNLVL